MTLIDSHCHLDDQQFDSDQDDVIKRAFDAGVEFMMTIGSSAGPEDLESGIRLADAHPEVYVALGVHPHDASKANPQTFRRLEESLRHPKVIAVGEIGLDYYYDFSPREQQKSVFLEQLRVASDARKPVVIHTRDAWEDTFELLERHWLATGLGGIMHCFSSGPDHAARAVELGLHVSFSGIVTFHKALPVQRAARDVPKDRLLMETDAPYLAPEPHRGKRNEPSHIVHIARKIAELRATSEERIAELTTANFRKLCLPAVNVAK